MNYTVFPAQIGANYKKLKAVKLGQVEVKYGKFSKFNAKLVNNFFLNKKLVDKFGT